MYFVYQAVEDRGIHAGKVNCDTYQRLCQEAQVNAYPSVRFYAGTSKSGSAQVCAAHYMQVFIMLSWLRFVAVRTFLLYFGCLFVRTLE